MFIKSCYRRGGKEQYLPVVHALVHITDTLQRQHQEREGDTILRRQREARVTRSETKINFPLPATGIFTVFHAFQNCFPL